MDILIQFLLFQARQRSPLRQVLTALRPHFRAAANPEMVTVPLFQALPRLRGTVTASHLLFLPAANLGTATVPFSQARLRPKDTSILPAASRATVPQHRLHPAASLTALVTRPSRSLQPLNTQRTRPLLATRSLRLTALKSSLLAPPLP